MIECSTFFVKEQRVAKVSKGLFPPPFLITFQYVFELLNGKYIAGKLEYNTFFKKIYHSLKNVFRTKTSEIILNGYLQVKNRLDLINHVKFFPGKKFNLFFNSSIIRRFENLGDFFGSFTHVTICRCFQVNGIS